MFRRCPRNHTARVAPRNRSFLLFKPLLVIACGAIMFELLPIDFQNWMAPSLVSYHEVYESMYDDTPSFPARIATPDCAEEYTAYPHGRPGSSL